MTHLYRVAGFSVGSDIALPGLIGDETGDGPPDIAIRLASVCQRLDGASAVGPTWELAGDRFLLRIPSIARFLLTGGREIAFETEDGRSLEDVAPFLMGTVFGLLLHQRRRFVLHASAVCVDGKAVLFCGPAGAGKSTLAAALIQRGYPLVTDDFCAVEPGAVPLVHPDGRQLKLWAEAVAELGLDASQGSPVRREVRKFYVEPAAARRDALPLGAVYLLREAYAPHSPGIVPVNIAEAVLLLQRSAFRPRLARRLGLREDYFRAAAAIIGAASVFELRRPFGFAALPRMLDGLEEHWAALDLVPRAA